MGSLCGMISLIGNEPLEVDKSALTGVKYNFPQCGGSMFAIGESIHTVQHGFCP